MRRVVVIGVGGIGKFLVPPLARFLNFRDEEWQLVLVDGDQYEDKNRTRQSFGNAQGRAILDQLEKALDQLGLAESKKALEPTLNWAHEELGGLGNKAEVTARELRAEFSRLAISALPCFVQGPTDEVRPAWEGRTIPVSEVLKEEDFVFLCVDNHKTRKTVSEFCETLQSVKLFSGGNNLNDGNVQIFIKKNGRNIFPSLTATHPEIANPDDKAPHEMHCEELAAAGSPQVIFANLTAATAMLNAFYAELQRKLQYEEVYFDILAGRVMPPLRVNAKGTQAPAAQKPAKPARTEQPITMGELLREELARRA